MTKLTLSNARALFFFALFLVPTFLQASRLHLLVRGNDVEEVRQYLRSSPRALFELNARDEALETPLQIAVNLRNEEMRALLIEHGAKEVGIESGSPQRRVNRSRDPEYQRGSDSERVRSAHRHSNTHLADRVVSAPAAAASAATDVAEPNEDGIDTDDEEDGMVFRFDK